jgi:hypothetical protein
MRKDGFKHGSAAEPKRTRFQTPSPHSKDFMTCSTGTELDWGFLISPGTSVNPAGTGTSTPVLIDAGVSGIDDSGFCESL